ncbi:MAG: tetratricopeptide repeat protein [Nitrospinae bacterium]|nr:tetratricopeptide repeat protein [Nitrospinota bacterium]
MRKIGLFVVTALAVAVGLGWLGFALAVPQAKPVVKKPNKMLTAELKTGPEVSTVTFTFEAAPAYRIEPDPQKKMYTLVVTGATHNPALEYKAFEDNRVKRMEFYQRAGGKDTLAEIVLKDIKTSIYHSLSADGKTLTLMFKSRRELMTLQTNPESAEEVAARAKRDVEMAQKAKKLLGESGRDDFKDATDDYRKGDYKSAIVKLAAFVERYPKSVYVERAYFLRAEALYLLTSKERRYGSRAITAYIEASTKCPASEASARARVRLADLYSSQEMDVEALAVYQAIMENFPGSKYALHAMLGRSRIYLARKLYYEAYNELEKILLLYPEAKEVRDAKFQIAEAYYLRGKYEDAARVFESADKRWPSFVRTNRLSLYRYADTYFKLKKYPRAMELFADLLNLFPGTGEGREAVNRLADIYINRGDISSAVRLLGIQARNAPETHEGLDSRLRLAALGQYPQKVVSPDEGMVSTFTDYFNPLGAYNDIIKKHPKELQAREALYQKAKLYNRQDRYIESIVTLKALMKRFPELATSTQVLDLVRTNLQAMVRGFHGQEGYYAVLYAWYDNFDPFFADTHDPEVLMNVGDAYFEMGLFSRSLDRFMDAKKLDDKGLFKERLAFGEGRAFAALKQYDDAVRRLSPFTGQYGSSPFATPAMHLLGGVYEAKGDDLMAIDSWRRAVALEKEGPKASFAAYHAGMLLKKRGDYRLAVAQFDMAIEKYRPLPPYDDYYFVDSHFQIMESAYRGRMYTQAVTFANYAQKTYPEAPQASWAKYVKSDCEARLSEDEKAVASLKKLGDDEPATVYGKVAVAAVANAGWKDKNFSLFPY